jgi:hypothetical protein
MHILHKGREVRTSLDRNVDRVITKQSRARMLSMISMPHLPEKVAVERHPGADA